MKKLFLITTIIIGLTFGACSNSEAPMTEKQMAEKYGLTMDEYKEMKDAAARMNMTFEEHMKMMADPEHEMMME